MVYGWIIVIGAIVFAIWYLANKQVGHRPNLDDDALTNLENRYTKGEITKEEYSDHKEITKSTK